MDESQFPKRFDFKDSESHAWNLWEKNQVFSATVEPNRRPFCVVMPPPNVTGILHMGHVLDNVPQDVMTRWHRMRGFAALWVPGTDHAGIATQNVVKRQLDKEGIDFRKLGREEFIRRVWEWKDKSGGTIIEQLKRLGCSCDWSRERFTMDEQLSRAVQEAFIRMYSRGLIYRGKRIINWCVTCGTALANDEVDHEERKSSLWYIKYPLVGSKAGEHVLVATTRPETMLGDVAVAVHPDDERYRKYIGQKLLLPLVNREIELLADAMVDPAFGTGAVKITPAHDANDYQVSLRHNLPAIQALGENGKVNEGFGSYSGLDRFKARKKVVADLEEAGLLGRTEDHTNAVGKCYRCESVIEPFLSDQWFVKMRPLAEKAKAAVETGKLKIIPESEKNDYFHWMNTIDDWCISRQLWWGHRIPAYHCQSCAEITVAPTPPAACGKCGGKELVQDPDVLDTWFSSQLWPYSTLGWPDETPELKFWYPNSWLMSGRDILFFWDSRMIMSGLELVGDVPFRTLVLHGLVRDEQGRKLSKSLGNSPDPLKLFDEHGADAVRAAMMNRYPLGRQDTRLGDNAFKGGSALITKLWNSCRFIVLNAEGNTLSFDSTKCGRKFVEDRWILSRLGKTVAEHDQHLSESAFAQAFDCIHGFFRNEFCDWYLEIIKRRMRDQNEQGEAMATSLCCLRTVLKLFHPYIPFVTEELWQLFRSLGVQDTAAPETSEVLALLSWPNNADFPADAAAETIIDELSSIVRGVREIRSILDIAPKIPLTVILSTFEKQGESRLTQSEDAVKFLAGIEKLSITALESPPPSHIPFTFLSGVGYLQLPSTTNPAETKNLLETRLKKMRPRLSQLQDRLSNEDYVRRAQESALAETRKEAADLRESIDKLEKFQGLLG